MQLFWTRMTRIRRINADFLDRSVRLKPYKRKLASNEKVMRESSDILREISSFEPNDGEWLPLDGLLEELWSSGVTKDALPVLFGVFERYPEDDSAGVLWSIVHGVEALPFEYEALLKESMERESSLMAAVMLKRLANSRAG